MVDGTINPVVVALEALLRAAELTRIDSDDPIALPDTAAVDMMISVEFVSSTPQQRLMFIGNIGNQTAFLSVDSVAVADTGIPIPINTVPVVLPIPEGRTVNAITKTGPTILSFQIFG